MADWKENLLPGSFRGVPFKIESYEFVSGRRNVDHEFPSKEEGNSEDLGKRLPGHNLELYVLGDDYFAERDALKQAINDESGPGKLIHPYLGELEVQVADFSIRESVKQGRIARFSVRFVTAGTAQFPGQDDDAVGGLLGDAINIYNSIVDDIDAVVAVANFPGRVATFAAATVRKALDKFNDDVIKKLKSVPNGVADVALAINDINRDVETLLDTPRLLGVAWRNAFDLVFAAVEDKKELATLLSGLSNFEDDPIVNPAVTPTTAQIVGNQTAIEDMVISMSLVTQAKAAVSGNYVSADESVDVLNLLNRDIDRQLARPTTSDDVFQELKDMRVQANNALPPRAAGTIIEFTPLASTPVLVVSHSLFGTISKESEIIAQNKVVHPGFLPAREKIEVTSGI